MSNPYLIDSSNNPYSLRNIRYFNAYNKITKQLEYTKFNFNFEKYKIEFKLQDKTKLEVFDDFLTRNGWKHNEPTVVKQEFKQYFTQLTSSMKTYNDYLDFDRVV